ncbi:MAG: galactose-1-phosphate uridylyltransferase [Pseudomonadota bacterium]
MPELRKDPIIDRWVIIATERSKRPSDLNVQKSTARGGFCPLCPGNEDKTPSEVFAFREGNTPPDTPGWKLRVVPNKFPALTTEGEPNRRSEGIYDKMNGLGSHEIIIETPDHYANASTLTVDDFKHILIAYRQRIIALKNDHRFRYIAVFKNHGDLAGSTLEHPHSQMIALPVVPKRAMEEIDGSQGYYTHKNRCVFCDIISQELSDGRRVVVENDKFLAYEPFASRFPFETCVLPKQHASSFEDADESMFDAMAEVFSLTLKKINKALGFPPYNYMLHSSPLNRDVRDFYHWHFEIIPRLTRVAGFEWGTGFYMNPTPPEYAAEYLRDAQIE